MLLLVFHYRRFLLALLTLSISAFIPQAMAQTPDDAAFAAALTRFNRARQGETDQLDAAIAAFRAAPGKPALQPLNLVYLGSAETLKAKAAWMPWNKLKFADQGLDHIDQALAALRPEHDQLLVQGTPASLLTRMVAASTFIAVPDGLFHRRAAGKSLLAEMRRSPLLAAAPAGFRAELNAAEVLLHEAEK